jgi:hypothetical protein
MQSDENKAEIKIIYFIRQAGFLEISRTNKTGDTTPRA